MWAVDLESVCSRSKVHGLGSMIVSRRLNHPEREKRAVREAREGILAGPTQIAISPFEQIILSTLVPLISQSQLDMCLEQLLNCAKHARNVSILCFSSWSTDQVCNNQSANFLKVDNLFLCLQYHTSFTYVLILVRNGRTY